MAVSTAGAIGIPATVMAQSYNHWTRSFNEESSLLSGAVVGGGAGPSAIYYNPSTISEINESKFSLHASLFSLNSLRVKNALGDGINLDYFRGTIEPRFLSYMVKPKKYPNWRLEFAFLNNENYRTEYTQSVDMNMDILTNIPGLERYYAYFQYSNKFRDDWIGFGASLKLNERFFVGASMFVSIKSDEYTYTLDLEAFPLDSVFINGQYLPFYSASYQEMDYVKYNDYRLVWKIGLLYKADRLSVGINVTTPSVGGIYSDGKNVMRKVARNNITLPETGEPLPNYVIADYKEKKDMSVNVKSPFSVSAGLTYYFPEVDQVLYSTVEYFGGIDPWKIIEADENQDIAPSFVSDEINLNEWLTFVSGINPVFNAAIGYRWQVKKDLELMAGFRTDFNYRDDLSNEHALVNKVMYGSNVDIHHLTGGLAWRIKGQDLITGLQYTIGRNKNQTQYYNLSDPVEYNLVEMAPLQGTRQNTMNSLWNSLSFYFGATFNFGSK
ncbi:MAG: hypothetical protein R2750_08760 [Bacteroidales bacterium]